MTHDAPSACSGVVHLTPCGEGFVLDEESGQMVLRHDLLICEYGCSAAEIIAKEYVEKKIINEFNI